MMAPGPASTFLFLQGPHGVLFSRLADALRAAGHVVHRINLNGGDQLDWIGAATAYRGSLKAWPVFFDDFVLEHGITDLVLFGDCRPHHATARSLSRPRGVRVHVLEEGYIRPDFMTLEEGGVNGHSSLPRDPNWYREEARRLPEPVMPPEIPSSFGRRLRETSRYTLASALMLPAYPFYRSHRTEGMVTEAVGWAVRFALRGRERRLAARCWEKLEGRPYFAVPLQLNTDYQLRVHSPFNDMRGALRFIMKSFARSAPADANLVIKRHPLDNGMAHWRHLVAGLAARYGIEDRVFYLGDWDIATLVTGARGVVTVNSTVGTLALNAGVPVAVLGEAVYNLDGIVFNGSLDGFWRAPPPPDMTLYDAFRRVLIARCLIPGGYLSEEGVAMLVENARARLTDRLIETPVPAPAPVEAMSPC